MNTVKPKVLALGMYAIDVEPIPPHNRNNREVNLDYLKHLKECVETLREVVEEVIIEKPLDNALENACFYTKRSQELLEYVIGTCLKEFNKRDKKRHVTTTTTLPTPQPPPPQSTIDPDLATRVSALEKRTANFEQKNKLHDKTTQALASRVYKLKHHDLYSKIEKQVNEVFKEIIHNALQAPLRERFRNLSEFQMKGILHDQMFESNSYRSHPYHTTLYKALKDSDRSKKKKHDFDVSASKQPPVQKSSALKTSDSREAPSSSSKQKLAFLSEQPINDDPIPVYMHLLELEDTGAAHLPKIKTIPDWLKLYQKKKHLNQTRCASFIKWYCKQIGKKKLVKAEFEAQAYKIVRPVYKNIVSLQFQIEECHLLLIDQIDLINPEGNRVVHDVGKPVLLGGQPGQVTIQAQYFFNKDLEYLVFGNKERRHASTISKLKAAYYPDFKIKELVLSLWTESESAYDISSAYVRSHMKILRVVSLKTCSRYGYTLQKEIVLRRAYYNEYKISEADFKNLHPNDFEDMYLLNLQGKLNHLSRADKVHLSNAKKMTRETEVHKFSDGTLWRILEKLDYMVKDYELYKYNPGMENRIWIEDNKWRSQEFIKLIERRLKIKRIFRSLKSFVSKRIRDIDYRLIDITE
nr:hypothetical protein [Tanacetum cinerariifolium]